MDWETRLELLLEQRESIPLLSNRAHFPPHSKRLSQTDIHIHLVACHQTCTLDNIVATLLWSKAIESRCMNMHPAVVVRASVVTTESPSTAEEPDTAVPTLAHPPSSPEKKILVLPYLPITRAEFLLRPEIQFLGGTALAAEFVFFDTCPEWIAYSEFVVSEADASYTHRGFLPDVLMTRAVLKATESVTRIVSEAAVAAKTKLESTKQKRMTLPSRLTSLSFTTAGSGEMKKLARKNTDVTDTAENDRFRKHQLSGTVADNVELKRAPCPCYPFFRHRQFPCARAMTTSLIGHQHTYLPRCMPVWAVIDTHAKRRMSYEHEHIHGHVDTCHVQSCTGCLSMAMVLPKRSLELHEPALSIQQIQQTAAPNKTTTLVRLVLQLIERLSVVTSAAPPTPTATPTPLSPGMTADDSMTRSHMIGPFAQKHGCANLCMAVIMQHTRGFAADYTSAYDSYLLRELLPYVTPVEWMINVKQILYHQFNKHMVHALATALPGPALMRLYTTTVSAPDRSVRVRIVYLPITYAEFRARFDRDEDVVDDRKDKGTENPSSWQTLSTLCGGQTEIHMVLTKLGAISSASESPSSEPAAESKTRASPIVDMERKVMVCSRFSQGDVFFQHFLLDFIQRSCRMNSDKTATLPNVESDKAPRRVYHFRQRSNSVTPHVADSTTEIKLRRWFHKLCSEYVVSKRSSGGIG